MDTTEAAEDLVQLASERSLMCVGIDTEFRFSGEGVKVGTGGKVRVAFDPRSVVPQLMSISLLECADRLPLADPYNFVVDLRIADVVRALAPLFRLPCTFVGHYLAAELHCMWKLELEEPGKLWDTWVAERIRYLGRHNLHYHIATGANDNEMATAADDAQNEQELRFGLVQTAQRHGIAHEFAADKDRLQQSFLLHPHGQEFSAEQIRYAMVDAEVAARLYEPQVHAATRGGSLRHLIEVEMPWVTVNARMGWNGVRIDLSKQAAIPAKCGVRLAGLEAELATMGLKNPRSHPELIEFFKSLGLLHLFRRGTGYCFNKDIVKELAHLHPALGKLHEVRKLTSMQADKILLPSLVGADGRMHPEHRQLGADSGRQSSRDPNILGLDKRLRPLVIPEPGNGIGEVDLCQIEVGIAAAVYGDEQLVEMFNTGDVYSRMAQLFYHDELGAEDRIMTGEVFKKAHADKRNRMKTCTLGIIYGLTASGLAIRLNIDQRHGEGLLTKFMTMFPALARALADASYFGGQRGFATTITDVRRYRGKSGSLSGWENNWMRNHPIQGSAATLFKVAGIRLDRLYRRYNARLIVPFHDAYVFESPLNHLREVAELTARCMCDAVSIAFPNLLPRAEINITSPSCWNKDGDAGTLERWLASPV